MSSSFDGSVIQHRKPREAIWIKRSFSSLFSLKFNIKSGTKFNCLGRFPGLLPPLSLRSPAKPARIAQVSARNAPRLVGPEEEREPLGFRTFFNHHDVVMMMTRSAVLGTLSARGSWRKNRKCVTKPVLKHHTPGFLRHETPARSALKSAPVHALLRDPLREHFRAQLSKLTKVSCIE